MGMSLEKLVYLPFNLKFVVLLVLSLTVTYVVSTYHLFFEEIHHKGWILAPCIIPFVYDVVAGFIHKNHPSMSAKRDHKPRASLQIFIEIVMLILSVICLTNTTSKKLLMAVNPLRIWKIFYCYLATSHLVGQESMASFLIKFLIFSIILIHTFSCMWYRLMLYEEELGIVSWKVLVETSKVLSDSVWEWYIVCSYFVANTFTTIGFGDIVGITDNEKVLSLFIMVVGYITVTGIFLAAFTTFLTLRHKYYAIYKQRRSLIHKAFIVDYFPSKETSDSIKLFYDRFWQEEEGIYQSELVKKFPFKLQELISYDIYKDALNACPLLEDLPFAVKKTLSTCMTRNIFLPGWKIIEKEGWLDTYIFINYGVAQVLTDEDDESSVFAVGLGSCLCVSGLVMSRPSKVNVNAATYCITHELKRSDLFSVLKHYAGTNHLVFKRFQKTMNLVQKIVAVESMIKKSGLKELKGNLDKLMKGITRSKEIVWFSEHESEIKSLKETKDMTAVCRKLMHMNYIPAVETEEIMRDDACIKTEFPWVLEPNSQFLKCWGYLVVFTALLASLLIPYFAAFKRDIPQQAGLVFSYINIVYLLDLVFVCITAQEMPGGRVTNSKEILKLKVKGVDFIIDVIGSVPLDLIALCISLKIEPRMKPLLKLNQLIGMVKVQKFFFRMENGFEVNLITLKIIKYILYFFITSYWLGGIYYSMACFTKQCNRTSWFEFLTVSDFKVIPHKVKHQFPFEISIYFGLLVITQAGFGDISAHNVQEMCVLLIFFCIGTFLFCYLISDYSATLTLQGSYQHAFVQFMNIMLRILENNKIPNSVKTRITNFMYLQWQHRQGFTVLHDEDIMWDLPKCLKTAMKIEHTNRELRTVPLLAAMGDEFLNELSLRVKTYMIPPNEVIAYAGSTCNEFYLIEEGNCQMIDGKGKVIRIIHSGEFFNLLEMIVGLRSIHNIVTATHCRVVLITKNQIDCSLSILNIESMQDQLRLMVADVQASHDLKRIKIHRALKISEKLETQAPSGFLFSAGHRAHPNIDYLEPFSHYGFLSGMRFILMPITINPNGPFMWWWEVFRGLCAFISSMIFPILPYITVFYPNSIWIPISLDVSAFLDLYIRLHICYYNDIGLLVLHPLSTAVNYFRTGFVIDFIAWLPLNYFISHHPYQKRKGFSWINEPLDLIRCNRLLQMHRLISWFVYREKQILKKTVFITFTKYFIISLVFLNTLAFWLELLTINFAYNPDTKEVDWQMLKNKHSWIYTYIPDFELSSLENILNLHLMAYYWTASVALSIGPGDISAQNGNEMFFVCGVVVLGFLYYTYVLVIIANAKASIDLNLTIYQERMQSFVSFMRNEDVSRDLQKLSIQHFERVWQRTRGVSLNSMLTKFTITLREDCLLQMYEKTFMIVPIFQGVRSSVFRELSNYVEELYYIKGEAVIRQNDVISSVMIVHAGVVDVIDSVGLKIAALSPGSIFGNLIYNCPAVRCNVSFIVSKNADILKITVTKFFDIVHNLKKIMHRLEDSTYDGMTYIPVKQTTFLSDTDFREFQRQKQDEPEKGTKDDEEDEPIIEEAVVKKSALYWIICVSQIVHGTFLTTVEVGFNLISVVLCSYDLAFQSEHLFLPIYVLEAGFIITMFLRFFNNYEDSNGEMVSDVRKISLRYIKEPTGFIFDLIINLPLGLVLKYTVSHYAMTWANVTHLLRLIKVFKFIEVRSDRLNVKVVYIKILVILITFTLMAHIFACCWNVVNCPRNICSSRPCSNDYLCALYYIVVTLTSTGYGDIGPHSRIEYFYVVLMIIGSRFIFAIFLGDITNAIQTYNYSFLTYEFQLSMMKKYMHVNGVSSAVNYNIIDYCKRLWQGNNGEQIPVFYKQISSCLQQDLSMEIYGNHFVKSFLFIGLHKDLLRQIICMCNQSIYHPGGVIAEENQVNDTMFIIHKGLVCSKSFTSSTVTVLKEKDFFGVPQGLFHDTPHTRTYTAISVCVILELCLSDWEYLLNFFPASKVELYDRAKRMEKLCEDMGLQMLTTIQCGEQPSIFTYHFQIHIDYGEQYYRNGFDCYRTLMTGLDIGLYPMPF